MDIQTFLDQSMVKMRTDRLATSKQLLLGELILKLELVKGKDKPISFDFGMKVGQAMSWRGSYCELALGYSEKGGVESSWNSDTVSWESKDGEYKSYEQDAFKLPDNPTTQDVLNMLKTVLDKEMVGYKGGDFLMHKDVAVYISNYSESTVDNYLGEEYATVAPFDVVEGEDKVTILTQKVDY